ncbi:hypothetical protein DMENIID0001_152500 [Sergentomyia squamirostris]
MNEEEEECCGSGCNNCVLDRRLKKKPIDSGSFTNILNGNYVKFTIENIQKVTTSVYKISFQCSADEVTDNSVLEMPPGWYLQLRCQIQKIHQDSNSIFNEFTNFLSPEDFKSQLETQERHDKDTSSDYLSRPYTPINIDSGKLTFDILFKLEKFGKMSQLITKFHPKDLVEFKGPYGDLVYHANTFKHLYLFSHGVAIAPLYSLISSILANEADETFIHLFVCFGNITEILLRDELVNLKQFWNLNASIYLAHEPGDIVNQVKFRETIHTERLGVKNIKELIRFQDEKSYFLICGTDKFTQEVCSSLRALDISLENIFIFR